MTYKISKNIPVPDYAGPGGPSKYPWHKMEIGDSILVPSVTAVASGHQYGKRHGMKFNARKLSDGTHRIWRIE